MAIRWRDRKTLDSMSKQDILDFHYDYNVAMSEAFSPVYKRPDDYPRFKNRGHRHICSWPSLDAYVKEKGWLNEL